MLFLLMILIYCCILCWWLPNPYLLQYWQGLYLKNIASYSNFKSTECLEGSVLYSLRSLDIAPSNYPDTKTFKNSKFLSGSYATLYFAYRILLTNFFYAYCYWVHKPFLETTSLSRYRITYKKPIFLKNQ